LRRYGGKRIGDIEDVAAVHDSKAVVIETADLHAQISMRPMAVSSR
jgi:hypothetical protein